MIVRVHGTGGRSFYLVFRGMAAAGVNFCAGVTSSSKVKYSP